MVCHDSLNNIGDLRVTSLIDSLADSCEATAACSGSKDFNIAGIPPYEGRKRRVSGKRHVGLCRSR